MLLGLSDVFELIGKWDECQNPTFAKLGQKALRSLLFLFHSQFFLIQQSQLLVKLTQTSWVFPNEFCDYSSLFLARSSVWNIRLCSLPLALDPGKLFMNKLFHYLVRGIILYKDQVLLAHQIGANNTFLPGGHIEHGERAEHALCREIFEELNKKAIINCFVGAIEHSWQQEKVNHFEINLVFKVKVEDLSSSNEPVSFEEQLEFFWAPIDSLENHNLKPFPLIDCIRTLDNRNAYWDSTL